MTRTLCREPCANDGPKAAPARVEERSIDEARPLRVVIIGSGISGIISSIRFRQRLPNLDLCVYEKNHDIGGTWLENRYPGCACDIPAHTYQATFAPNKEWSTFYAGAKEIHQYWKTVAEKYDCLEYVQFQHQVCEAVWDETHGKWHLKVQDLTTGTMHPDNCDVLISATGALNSWKWPSIPGLHSFKGKLMHSAAWDESYDYTNKKVAVIGNGSSGIQIVPGMLPKVAHIDHYMRGRTWLSPTFARHEIDKRGVELENFSFTPDEIKRFKEDHQAYQEFRKNIELELQSIHGTTILNHPAQKSAKPSFTENMKRRLAADPALFDSLVPSFSPACRRLTPGPGYLEALTNPAVTVIQDAIEGVDADGIVTADGKHRSVDMIVCATGFDTSFAPRFPLLGRGGISLSERWNSSPSPSSLKSKSKSTSNTNGTHTHTHPQSETETTTTTPDTYLSCTVDNFPNYFICLGPNAALGEGSLLLLVEKEIDYFTKCVAKMQRDNVRGMSPTPAAVRRFAAHCEEYFKRTVFGERCRSWYKGGREDGRVTALWPGSSLHAVKTFENPRWEDFEYTYVNDNPSGWLGDGWTEEEKKGTVSVDYLDDERVDFPTNIQV